MVDATDLSIRVAHYPPGCSKYNPIEHRLFPHVTRKLKGLFLKSLEMFRDLAKRPQPAPACSVFARSCAACTKSAKHAIVQSVEQLRIRYDPSCHIGTTSFPKPIWEVI